ncbi:MAG: hypothetical protein AAF085_05655 [Planctomycetota bacterium]
MGLGFVLIAFVLCVFSTGLLLLLAFLLLPWARQRMGDWALALIPASTFGGAYLGWVLTLLLIAD